MFRRICFVLLLLTLVVPISCAPAKPQPLYYYHGKRVHIGDDRVGYINSNSGKYYNVRYFDNLGVVQFMGMHESELDALNPEPSP